MIKKVLLGVVLITQSITYGKGDELYVMSLLRDSKLFSAKGGFTDNYIPYAEDYKMHMWKIRQKNKSEIVRYDSARYAEAVYTVILSEILRSVDYWNPYSFCGAKSAHYNDNRGRGKSETLKVMEFYEKDGFVPVSQYTPANYNYVLLMNVINNIHYDIVKIINENTWCFGVCRSDVMKRMKNVRFDNDYVKRVAEDILKKTGNKYDRVKMNHAVKDIQVYMTELELYEYLPKLYVYPECATKDNVDLGKSKDGMHKTGESKIYPNTIYKKIHEGRPARPEDGEGAMYVFREREQLEQTFNINDYSSKAVQGLSGEQALTEYKKGNKSNDREEISKFYVFASSIKGLWNDKETQRLISYNAKLYRDRYGTDEQDDKKKIFKVVEDMFNIIDWIRALAYEDISYIRNANDSIEEILRNEGYINDTSTDNKTKGAKLYEYLKKLINDRKKL